MNEEITSPYNAPLSTDVQSAGEQVKRLRRVGVLQTGIVYGVLLAVLALFMLLLYLPFVIIGGATLASGMGEIGSGGGIIGMYLLFLVLGPIIYGVMGFVGGVISAAVYNLVAKFTGGLELTFTDVMR